MNFSPRIAELAREARSLDRLGLPTPMPAMHAVLQADRWRATSHALAVALAALYKVRTWIKQNCFCTVLALASVEVVAIDRLVACQVTESLQTLEQHLLSTQLATLRRALAPGFLPLNWHSLGIPEFTTSIDKVPLR